MGISSGVLRAGACVAAAGVAMVVAAWASGAGQPGSPPAPGDPLSTLSRPRQNPVVKIPDDAIETVYLPPGKYTAIVLTSSAREKKVVVTLKVGKGSFPVTIAPQSTLVIPFEQGWTVQASDNARLESAYTPFEDISLRNPLADNDNLGVSAWGITPSGPVNFAPPKRP
jgi:hypothetical protein